MRSRGGPPCGGSCRRGAHRDARTGPASRATRACDITPDRRTILVSWNVSEKSRTFQNAEITVVSVFAALERDLIGERLETIALSTLERVRAVARTRGSVYRSM